MRRLPPRRLPLPLIGVALVAAGCADERQDVFTPDAYLQTVGPPPPRLDDGEP